MVDVDDSRTPEPAAAAAPHSPPKSMLGPIAWMFVGMLLALGLMFLAMIVVAGSVVTNC